MPHPRPVNVKTLPKVLDQLLSELQTQDARDSFIVEVRDWVKQHKDLARDFCSALDDLLNWASSNDFFGTEGQLDPRGDERNY